MTEKAKGKPRQILEAATPQLELRSLIRRNMSAITGTSEPVKWARCQDSKKTGDWNPLPFLLV